ncbi:MAG: hypothetical protein H6715_00300 [Myxococcales bacterium]|nr:hypothetical protein [Myxococcales bacterium]MCB9707405.1 hypothetical protein [Myxococcales bacterium]
MSARLSFYLVCCLLCGCSSQPEQYTYALALSVKAADAVPLSEVPIYLNDAWRGKTDKNGELQIKVRAEMNQTVMAKAECPRGYRAAEGPITIRLRQFQNLSAGNKNTGLVYGFTCEPEKVSSAVVVSTNAPGLPLLVQGREVGRTNADGVAHLVLESAPSTEFTLLIDTRGQPQLRPQYPTRTFDVGPIDDYYVLVQTFEMQQPKRHQRRARRLPAHMPIRIQ